MSSTKSLVQALSRFSTCEISDALIKLKLPHGGHMPGVSMYSPSTSLAATASASSARICGPAFTVLMVSQTDTAAPKPAQHFVDATQGHEGCVMVVSAPPATRSAVWGGLMSARAQYNGVMGVVIDGRCRDLTEHRDSGFPVFARGHSTLGQSPFTRPSELQVPLTIRDPTLSTTTSPSSAEDAFADLVVNPGDLILADVDGVVAVPPALVDQAIELATKGREVDDKCMRDLKAGKGIAETFKLHRGK